MLQTLFNPTGRINPSQFNSGAIILIVVGALLALVPLLGLDPALAMLIGVLGYVTWYSWVVLFMGRYRDGGQNPVKCLIPIVVYVVISIIVVLIIIWPAFMELFRAALEASSDGQDQAAMEAELEAGLTELLQGDGMATLAPKLAAAGAVVSALIAFGFNRLIGPSKYAGSHNDETFR